MGNGISIVLVINIISRIPSDLTLLFEQFVKGKAIAFQVLNLAMCNYCNHSCIGRTYCNIAGWLNAELRYSIPEKYMEEDHMVVSPTYIPLKVNTAGVIPIIFASSLMQFPNCNCIIPWKR